MRLSRKDIYMQAGGVGQKVTSLSSNSAALGKIKNEQLGQHYQQSDKTAAVIHGGKRHQSSSLMKLAISGDQVSSKVKKISNMTKELLISSKGNIKNQDMLVQEQPSEIQ